MHRIITKILTPGDDVLVAIFADGEVVSFDVPKFFGDNPAFKKIQKEGFFENLEIDGMGYGVSWNDEFDLSSDGIYELGEHISKVDPNINLLVGQNINKLRLEKRMSQRDLSKDSGVIQAEICKIEQGKGNPTLTTLQKLAKSLGVSVSSLML